MTLLITALLVTNCFNISNSSSLQHGTRSLELKGHSELWKAFLSERWTPEEIDSELFNRMNTASNVVKFINQLRFQIDLLHETSAWQYVMVNHSPERVLNAHQSDLVTLFLDMGKDIWSIGKDKSNHQALKDLLSRVLQTSEYSSELSYALTKYVLHLLAPEIRAESIEKALVTTSPTVTQAWLPELLKNFPLLSQEWAYEVFKESIANLPIEKISNMILQKMMDSKRVLDVETAPINALMNLAYLKNREHDTKGQSTTLIAALIWRGTMGGTQSPSSGLVQYFSERKASGHPAASVPELFFSSTTEEQVLQQAENCVSNLNVRNEKLWRVETTPTDLISGLSSEKQFTDETLEKLVASLKHSITKEEQVLPIENRIPKYWITKYAICRWDGDIGCPLYLCLAAANLSAHLTTAEMKCHEYIQALEGLPSHIPAQGPMKTLLYRFGRIELAKINDTKAFLSHIIKHFWTNSTKQGSVHA